MHDNKKIELPLQAKNRKNMVYEETEELISLIKEIESLYKGINVLEDKSKLLEEAVFSAKIEGSTATIEDMQGLLYSSGNVTKKERMVFNIYEELHSLIMSDPINEDFLLRTWKYLGFKCTSNKIIQGFKYRWGGVTVGESMFKVDYRAPKGYRIGGMMEDLFKYIDIPVDENIGEIILKSGIIHFYFVYVHPFCDVNGRTTRFLAYKYLINSRLDNFNYVSISKQIYNKEQEYYKSLQLSENDKDNNITPFLIYYLNIVKEAFKDN